MTVQTVPTVPTVPELFDLSGRAALVTGASKGIGRAIALRLADAGANVLATDIDDPEGEQTVRLDRPGGGEVAFLHADASRVDEARRSVQACLERYGRLDVLVNNAGVFPASGALETSEALWDSVFALNVKGAFFHAQAAARAMIEAGHGGSIVNIASIDAYHPTGSLVHYDASKAALVMMTRSLAFELGRHGVRVNGVAPGSVATPGASAATEKIGAGLGMSAEQLMAGFLQRIPLGRTGEPDDIARAVLFLASPAADYVTGQTLVVDGGFLVS